MPIVRAHVALAAFDMARSGDPAKTSDIQLATMSALRSILREAVNGASGLPWREMP